MGILSVTMHNLNDNNDFYDADYGLFSKVDPSVQKERSQKHLEEWVQKRYGKKMANPFEVTDIEPVEIMVFSNYPGVLRLK